MTHYPDYQPGQKVRCIDDHSGAWFLRVGELYTIESTQRHDKTGQLLLNLVGMARAWEVERFEAAN